MVLRGRTFRIKMIKLTFILIMNAFALVLWGADQNTAVVLDSHKQDNPDLYDSEDDESVEMEAPPQGRKRGRPRDLENIQGPKAKVARLGETGLHNMELVAKLYNSDEIQSVEELLERTGLQSAKMVYSYLKQAESATLIKKGIPIFSSLRLSPLILRKW